MVYDTLLNFSNLPWTQKLQSFDEEVEGEAPRPEEVLWVRQGVMEERDEA